MPNGMFTGPGIDEIENVASGQNWDAHATIFDLHENFGFSDASLGSLWTSQDELGLPNLGGYTLSG